MGPNPLRRIVAQAKKGDPTPLPFFIQQTKRGREERKEEKRKGERGRKEEENEREGGKKKKRDTRFGFSPFLQSPLQRTHLLQRARAQI